MKKVYERELADRLDKYIDLASGLDEGQGKRPEASIVDALRAGAAHVMPAPEFVERLSVRLQHRAKESRATPRRLAFGRAAWTGAAVALAVLLALTLPALLGEQDLAPLPRLVHAADLGSAPVQSGLLSGADLVLVVDLPETPAQVAVYGATAAPLPACAQEAMAWAEEFGLPDPQVYRDPREPEAIVVLGSNGQRLTFRTFGPQGSIHYGDELAAAVEGPPLGFDRAAELAVAFLRTHGLLPDAYQVREPEGLASTPQSPMRMVEVVPELDGRLLRGDSAWATVAVNPDGDVSYAAFTPLTFERDGSYPVKSASEAYDELTGDRMTGSPFRLDTRSEAPPGMDARHYRREPAVYAPGEAVTITGWAQVLVAEDDSQVRARLETLDGTQYELEGRRVAELAGVGFENVQIQGTVVARLGSQQWQLNVANWKMVPRDPPACPTGTLTWEDGEAWLVTGEGPRYRLPDAPGELADGEGIQVCAEDQPVDGGAMAWWLISSPPASEQQGSVGSSSVSVVVVESEEVAPTAAGMPEPEPEPRFQVGQSVEVTGVVEAVIFVNGSARRVEARLDVDATGQELSPYPLSGPPDVLEAIAMLDRLHVRVRGRATASDEGWAPHGQGIEVESFEKMWPEEKVQGFLGYLDLETLKGRQVLVFVDKETGGRYVEASSLELGSSGLVPASIAGSQRQVFVGAVVEPGKRYAGLGVLRIVRMAQDEKVDAATSASELPLEFPHVIDESHMSPGSELQGAFVVDRVELAYYYEPQTSHPSFSPDGNPPAPQPVEQILQPVWVFYGHNADNSVTFVAYVQAVAEKYIQDGAVTGTTDDLSSPPPPPARATPTPLP